MQFLKADTSVTLKIGPFLDETNGKDAETGLTIAQADVRLSKNGGDIAQKNEATSCTHDELGIYGCPIDGTDTNTEGRLQLWVHEAGALPVWHEYMVVNANVYDSLYAAAATDYLDVNMKQVSDDATAADDLELLVENSKGTDHKVLLSTDAQDLSASLDVNTKLIEAGDPTDAINAACDASIETYKLDHLVAAADGDDPVDDSIIAKLVSKDATADWSDYDNTAESLEALHDGPLADIEADTQDLQTQVGTDGAGLTDLGGMSDAMKAEVEAECTDAIEADGLDHLLAASVTGTDITDNSIVAKLVSKEATADWDDFVNTSDSLQAIRDKETDIETDTDTTLPATLATIAAYIDAEVAAILTDTGTTLPATLATIAGYLDTEVAAIKAKTDLLPSGVPKNVALSNFTFLMVLSSDHITPATGKTITSQISKDGDAFANTTNSVSEITGGFYKIDITQTEINADVVALKFTETDCDQRSIVIKTST